MKRIITSLTLISIFICSNFSYAQQNSTGDYDNNKGEFHIGLNDFTISEEGSSRFRISPRFGYSITDMDLLYVEVSFTKFLDGVEEGHFWESTINYRRYLKSGQFRPFVQIGFGGGSQYQKNDFYNSEIRSQYFKAETGAGVSYRYKRWAFEAGIKANYNENSTDRVQIKPLVGVSFSF